MAKLAAPSPDWAALLKGWDKQQEASIPNRQTKFEAILDVLGAYLPKRFTALDLGSGPGSLSVQILRRFPQAVVVAVDFDPVLLRIGREASKGFRGRIGWVDADIGTAGWTDELPRRSFDAVVSSTAIHWLDEKRLRRLYVDLARILRRGGIFLNGDVLPLGKDKKTLGEIAEKIRHERHGTLRVEFAPWSRWWKKVERDEKALAPTFQERKARFTNAPASERMFPFEFHTRLLRDAGFSEADSVWQDLLQDRVLAAIR